MEIDMVDIKQFFDEDMIFWLEVRKINIYDDNDPIYSNYR